MRTNLSLDDELVLEIRRIQAASGRSKKDVVNDLIRRGLRVYEAERRLPVTRGARLGAPFLDDVDNVHKTLASAEGECRRYVR